MGEEGQLCELAEGRAEMGGHGGPSAGGLSPDAVLVTTPSLPGVQGPPYRPPCTLNAH